MTADWVKSATAAKSKKVGCIHQPAPRSHKVFTTPVHTLDLRIATWSCQTSMVAIALLDGLTLSPSMAMRVMHLRVGLAS